MAYETYRIPGAASACDAISAAQRLQPPITAMSRAKTPTPKLSETSLPERRAARIAKEQELAALCRRRASRWADAIREGLDPDIARFVRDQAAAWQLLATSYACSTRDALVEPVEGR
jgi:hypothetical protein